jgi:membrane protease YdiL (CAAX protease family)
MDICEREITFASRDIHVHFLSVLGPGLLAIIGILLFVAPFLDLPLSRRLQAAPTGQRRLLLYWLVIAYLWVLAGLAWVCRDGTEVHVLHAAGDPAWLFGVRWRTWTISAILVLFFALVFKPGVDALLRPRRVPAYTRAMKSLAWLLPHDAQQRRWFALLSVTAGVCEEWVLRGVVFHALNVKIGASITTSLLISSLLFGWNHLYQGRKAVGSTAAIGLAFGLLALLSGNLFVPILLHCAMDLQIVVFFRPDMPDDSRASIIN